MSRHSTVVPTQATYRKLLASMSHPGRAFKIESEGWSSPLMAVCDALLDHEVSYCALPGCDDTWDDEIFTLTKARREDVMHADYLIVNGASSEGAISYAKTGEPAFPDRGATIIYVSGAARPESVPSPLLSGPGIKDEAEPDLNPIERVEWQMLKQLNSEFPLGVDCIFVSDGGDIMCVPRSTKIRIV